MNAVYLYCTPSWDNLADVIMPSLSEYCDDHNYLLFVFGATDENWSQTKMDILLAVFRNHQFIWILDCDTLITNPSIPFTQFVDDQHDIFITKDVNGINAGSWIIRNTEASRKFVEMIVNNFDAPHEQILMERYIDMVKVKYLPHPSINSYKYELYDYGPMTHEEGQWEPGDLLLHLPGLSIEKRIEIFKSII